MDKPKLNTDKPKKEKKASAFMKPMRLSEELTAVIGPGPLARTEVAKKLWEYIKKHNLQDPKNKRNIIPDAKLAKVFGSSAAINMFAMTSKVSQHLKDAELATR
jgi:chromatin remodeling complex protein RSC6